MMHNYVNPITEEGGIQVLQNLLPSTYDHLTISKMSTTQVRFEFK